MSRRAVLVAAAVAARPGGGGPVVAVTDQAGREVAAVPLPEGAASRSATALVLTVRR